jgi:hypothetical protein
LQKKVGLISGSVWELEVLKRYVQKSPDANLLLRNHDLGIEVCVDTCTGGGQQAIHVGTSGFGKEVLQM